MFEITEALMNEIEDANDFLFDIETSINEAKIILKEEMSLSSFSLCHFEDDEWHLENLLYSKRYKIDFKPIREISRFNKELPDYFVDIVKCWTTSLIERYVVDTIVSMVKHGLIVFLNISKGLSACNEEEFSESFGELSVNTKRIICSASLNFFDYIQDPNYDDYITLLYELRKTYKVEENARLLPPTKDILVFSNIVKDFFSKKMTEQEYLKWFPVWLWWNLTTLIPLRPSEFCLIERNCLLEGNRAFYIKLPRKKQRKVGGKYIQILDKVYIPEQLFQKIQEYIQRTDKFGETDTLISYRSIPEIRYKELVNTKHTFKKRLNPRKFTLPIFENIIGRFYEFVIFDKYGVSLFDPDNPTDSKSSLQISQKVRPGDTRHIAFINMKRQGYHPLEIARIGGHTLIYSQEHYFNHIQSFVDLEVLEMITNINLDSYANKMKQSEINHTIGTSFIQKYLLRPTESETKIKLSDGYCTDPTQSCKVEDCWECDSWRICHEEFMEKKHSLEVKIRNSKSYLDDVISNLKNLYQGIYSNIGYDDFFSSDNSEMKKRLISESKHIDRAIEKYVNLMKVKERVTTNGDKREKA